MKEVFDSLFGDRPGAAVERLKARGGGLTPGQTKDDLRALILDKYDGYSWDGRTKVLNLWSIIKFFKDLIFEDYWAATGNPSFLLELIKKHHVSLDYFSDNYIISFKINTVIIN
jgi:hypothetical protein